MTELDLLHADWRTIGDTVAAPTTAPQPEPAADRRTNRYRARAAEKRTDRHDAVQTWTEKRQARREDRRADRADRRTLRAEKLADRAERHQRIRHRASALAQGALITGPIVAPMAVAWTGQSQFATSILGWVFAASILYAAAYELTTAYWAWLYHQARSDGDSGWEYRVATWVFALGAAAQQWWHYSDNWHPTPRSVTYSAMSAVGVLLWEGYARLIHRRKLRSEGKLPPARPRIGPARWVRYPVRSWTAWSLTILEGHQTLDAAWTAADAHLRSKAEARSARKTDRAATREAARLDRVDRAARRSAARSVGKSDADRAASVDRAAADRAALPPTGSGPDWTGPAEVNRRTARVDLTKRPKGGPAAGSDGSKTDRTCRTTSADRADRTAGAADRVATSLVLTDVERDAIDRLRSAGRSISKRSIADVVRNQMGRSISSDRAVEIARHFRTLRSAA